MKQVTKKTAPSSFISWKAQANDDWQPAYCNLQKPEKHALHQALLEEQGHVCCYCGRSITLTDSHIEHFRPQSTHAHLDLAYDNLHASCIRETAPGTPLHCGHAKGDALEEALAISPLEPGCERRFRYTPHDGAIYPTDHPTDSAGKKARYMLDLLKLDGSLLRAWRKNALERMFDPEFVKNAQVTELEQIAIAVKKTDANGKLQNFSHVIARYAEQLLNHTV